jgi:general secretion pathway protein C
MLDRSDLEESIGNIHQLLSEVRIRPHFKDGRADGLTITNMKAGSAFAKLGLRNGDIVHEIDGRDIKSPDDVLEVYTKLKSGSQVAIQISRGGVKRAINYKFK